MSQSATGASAFTKRNQNIIGAKLLSLIEKHPNGPPLDVLKLELHKDKLGTGDVTNFYSVQPATKPGPTRSKKPAAHGASRALSKKTPGASPPLIMPNVPKSPSLTSNHSTCSKSRGQKPRSAVNTNKCPRKGTSGKSPSIAQKPKTSSGPDQRRPATTSGDFANASTNKSRAQQPTTLRKSKTKGPQIQRKASTSSNAPIVSKTQVVLAPRFGPESSEPSIVNVVQYHQENSNKRCSTAPPGQIWRKSSSVTSTFTPEKAKWVQKAVYKFGESFWTAQGGIPPSVIDSPDFQDNIGELYDLAVKSKSQGLSLDSEGTQGKSSSDARTLSSDEHSDRSASSVGTHLSFSLAMSEDPPSFVTDTEQKVSDFILNALKDKLLRDKDMKDACTATHSDCFLNSEFDSKLDEFEKRDIETKKDDDLKGDEPRLIKNCYVSEGKLIPEDEPYKFTLSTFAPLSNSLRRLKPSLNDTYFRRSVNLKGFEVHELRFKYSSTRIFVEGKQPQRGDNNARLVREIIAIPPELNIDNLKVMRGLKGVVVFEEIVKSSRPPN